VSSTPCGECSICQEVAENRFIDLIEVDAASRTRVDDTRELLENAQYLPARGRYKVYLIDEVHMLSASSFNALLKTLEEPPEHVKFLLATTNPKQVPITVLSRCLQFQLKNISSERMEGYLADILQREQVEFDKEALSVVGKAARGSMRDALSIADQAISFGQGALRLESIVEMLGLVGRDEIGTLVDALVSGDASVLLAVVEELADRSVDFDALLAELLSSLHAMAVVHAVGGEDTPPFDPETVQLLYQIGLMGYRDLQIAPDPKSGVEMTLLRMLTFAPDARGQAVGRLDSSDSKETSNSKTSNSKVSDSAISESADASAVAEIAESPEPAGVPAVTKVNPAARQPQRAGERNPWHELIRTLEIAGVARMIAEHSLLAELGEEQVRLVLDSAHDTLLSESQTRVIERALTQTLGRTIHLTIDTGTLEEETPAQHRDRIAAERQRDAQNMLEADITVQSLLSEFDGRLDDVQPVSDPNLSGGIHP
jgi:DNA polymerase-3 subunit gamma/tau